MDAIAHFVFDAGRCMLSRLPHGEDLIGAVESFCVQNEIQTAVFSIIGAVVSATLGSYDQDQQVYVTYKKEEPFEIVSCTGNVSLKDGQISVHAHGVLADMDGRTTGGHVFSDTVIYAGEMYLQELLGRPPEREYDETTGLPLWRP